MWKRRRSETHQASYCNTSVETEDQEPSQENVPGIEAQTEVSAQDLDNVAKKMKGLEEQVLTAAWEHTENGSD